MSVGGGVLVQQALQQNLENQRRDLPHCPTYCQVVEQEPPRHPSSRETVMPFLLGFTIGLLLCVSLVLALIIKRILVLKESK